MTKMNNILMLQVDEEFERVIPPLDDDEFKNLRLNILRDGEIYYPIITWNGVIVDGHHRYKIFKYFYQVSKSKQSIKDGDLSQALVHLEKARFHAVEADKIEFDDRGEYAYTSPLFDKRSVDTSTFLHANDVPTLQKLAENLEGKDFDALRGNMKFQEIQNSLR